MNSRANPVRLSLGLFILGALLLTVTGWHYLDVSFITTAVVSLNLTTVPLWAWDKFQAKREGWRVPELTLHTVAVLGSAGTSLICMHLFRHKTRKRSFTVLYSVLLVLQVFGLLMYLRPPS
ncbi:MAG: uncharacterized membrane protein YsdA (DUF1294 family) [Planctomycetota bacterium]